MNNVKQIILNLAVERTGLFAAHLDTLKPKQAPKGKLSPKAQKVHEFLLEDPFGCNTPAVRTFASILLDEELPQVQPEKPVSMDFAGIGTCLHLLDDNGKKGAMFIRIREDSRDDWRRLDGKKSRCNLWNAKPSELYAPGEQEIRAALDKLTDAEAGILSMALV